MRRIAWPVVFAASFLIGLLSPVHVRIEVDPVMVYEIMRYLEGV